MRGPKSRAPLDEFLWWIEHTLQAGVESLPERPDAFLWNARRCAEAICLACLAKLPHAEAGSKNRGDDGRLESMITELTHRGVTIDLLSSLRSIQGFGNLGVHIPADGARIPLRKAGECAGNLCSAVPVFYEAVLERAMPPAVARSLEEIRDRSDDRRRAATGAARATPSTTLGPVVALSVLLTALVTAAGTTLVIGRPALRDALRSSPRPSGPPASATPSADAPAPTPEPRDEAATPPAPSPSMGEVPCPAGTLEFAGGPIVVGQPSPRPGWPPVRGASEAISVARFCLDAAPVSARDYEVCVRAGACEAPRAEGIPGCNWPVRSPDRPSNCVDWHRADAWCRWRGRTLPSLAQWEWAARHPQRSLRTNAVPTEWVREPFPAPVLRRGPAPLCGSVPCAFMTRWSLVNAAGGAPRYSWNRADHLDARPVLGFRCVLEPPARAVAP